MKLLPAAKNTAQYPGFQTEVNSLALQNWYQGRAQEEALNQNTNLASNFLNVTFHDWLRNYQDNKLNDGGNPNAVPPTPPLGWQVQVDDDGITCTLLQNGPPVCTLPSYAKIPAPQTLEQARHMLDVLGGNAGVVAVASPFNSSAGLYGTPIAAPDGSKWVRVA